MTIHGEPEPTNDRNNQGVFQYRCVKLVSVHPYQQE